jgi:class 3 adenylate cyclase/tetratricopeptide (TPR) repeat protein
MPPETELDARDPAASAAGSLLSYVPRQLRSWPADIAHRDVEGTLVSADLSGFTRLSERLAALGREGAEELTTLLNGCFTRMIAEIERFGGDVLKFGGDALLILYQGPRHTERACFSTIAMRDLIAEPLMTRTGTPVRLRISQGMHAGTFGLFVLDGNHRELMVTGPGVTETVECEGTANAGQILLSAEAAANVERSWLGRDVDGRRLLRRIVVLEETIDVENGRADDVDVTPFVPAAQREQIEVGAPAEHRRVAIGFVKFSHTDELIAKAGSKELGARLQQLAESVARAERDFGVHWLASDVYPDGGKVIITAGAPLTLGDDEERVLRAARQILDEIDDLDLRIGVNAGGVFVGDLGSPTRRAFTVMGDAVNLAARLMQKAESGQLIASDATLDRSPTRFETTELEPFFVKGKTVPIRASIVGAVQAKREQIGKLDLIGRDAELAVLLEAARSAREDRRGQVVELVGEPGAGKSRLLEEIRRRETDLQLFTAQCGQYARTSPYFAVQSMLRSIAGVPPSATPSEAAKLLSEFVDEVAPSMLPWLPLLAIPFDADIAPNQQVLRIAPQFRRARSHAAVADLMARALTNPTLVLVEDLHWIDDASRELLGELLPRLDKLPWLLVLTRRPGEPPLDVPDASRIDLQPLDADAARKLVLAAAGTDSGLLPADWDRLVERAGGNALFAIELADAARNQGSADALADSVESLVTSKIDTLPARDRILLRESSVLGAVIDTDLLADALEDDEVRVAARWRPLEDFLIPEGDAFRFRHAIHQHVAYEGLSYRRRREMHARAARAIHDRFEGQTEAVVGLLATHYSRAGDTDAAWEFSVKAGNEARGKYANTEAAEFYVQALDAARAVADAKPETVAEVADSLGEVRFLMSQYEGARRAFVTARKHSAPDSIPWAEFLRKEGRMLEREGRYSQALRSYSRALKALDRLGANETEETRAQLYASYGAARYWQGRMREGADWARRAIESAEHAGARAALAHALRLLEVCLEELGDPERYEWVGRALSVYEELNDETGIGDVLNNMGIAAYADGHFDEAMEFYRRSVRARERSGDVSGKATTSNNLAEVLLDQGRFDEARPLLEEALNVFRAAKQTSGITVIQMNLARSLVVSNIDRALELFDEAISFGENAGATALANEVRVRRLEALVISGRNREAAAYADDLAHIDSTNLGDRLVLNITRLRSWILLRLGDDDGALGCLDRVMPKLNDFGGVEFGFALQARAELSRRAGDEAAARADDQRAEELFTRLGVVWTPPLLLEK